MTIAAKWTFDVSIQGWLDPVIDINRCFGGRLHPRALLEVQCVVAGVAVLCLCLLWVSSVLVSFSHGSAAEGVILAATNQAVTQKVYDDRHMLTLAL